MFPSHLRQFSLQRRNSKAKRLRKYEKKVGNSWQKFTKILNIIIINVRILYLAT